MSNPLLDYLRIKVLSHFRFLPWDRRNEVLKQLSSSASPNFDYLLMVILSCGIATLGLLTNSAAVIIGAMLVAPLMSPILGLSLASVMGERHVFRRAVIALVRGILLAVALSALISWAAQLLPFDVLKELPAEVLARTRPTPFDLGIALAGGAAAAYALAQPQLSAALPGVAIATALMPPLCTVGIGISLRSPEVAFGAFMLFLTNLVAISFAGILVFVLLGFRPSKASEQSNGLPRSLYLSMGLVLIILIPLILFTLNLVKEARTEQAFRSYENIVRAAVSNELAQLLPGDLVDVNITQGETGLDLEVIVRTSRQPAYQTVVALQEAVAEQLQQPVALELMAIPVIQLDPLIPPTFTPTSTPGPSATPTTTPTSTPSIRPTTSTASQTPAPSDTPTVTPTPTATPMMANIANTAGRGIYLRQNPAGVVTGFLPEGAAVQILAGHETLNRIDWIEIQDQYGRTGWIVSQFVIIRP